MKTDWNEAEEVTLKGYNKNGQPRFSEGAMIGDNVPKENVYALLLAILDPQCPYTEDGHWSADASMAYMQGTKLKEVNTSIRRSEPQDIEDELDQLTTVGDSLVLSPNYYGFAKVAAAAV